MENRKRAQIKGWDMLLLWKGTRLLYLFFIPKRLWSTEDKDLNMIILELHDSTHNNHEQYFGHISTTLIM